MLIDPDVATVISSTDKRFIHTHDHTPMPVKTFEAIMNTIKAEVAAITPLQDSIAFKLFSRSADKKTIRKIHKEWEEQRSALSDKITQCQAQVMQLREELSYLEE